MNMQLQRPHQPLTSIWHQAAQKNINTGIAVQANSKELDVRHRCSSRNACKAFLTPPCSTSPYTTPAPPVRKMIAFAPFSTPPSAPADKIGLGRIRTYHRRPFTKSKDNHDRSCREKPGAKHDAKVLLSGSVKQKCNMRRNSPRTVRCIYSPCSTYTKVEGT